MAVTALEDVQEKSAIALSPSGIPKNEIAP
jgi:hypothetical protein